MYLLHTVILLSAPSPCRRLSRPQTTMSWSDFRAAFVRLTIRLNVTTWILQEHTRISQVPDASLYTCHGLITPLTRHNLTITIALHGLRWRYKPRQSELTILGAITALQDHDNPYGLYISLCTLHLFCSLAVFNFFFKEKKYTGK